MSRNPPEGFKEEQTTGSCVIHQVGALGQLALLPRPPGRVTRLALLAVRFSQNSRLLWSLLEGLP